jgi:hypothetical protein
METKKFNINAKNLFITYPKCPLSKEKIGDFLWGEFDCRFVKVSQEKHQDGSLHIHAFVQGNKKIHIRNARRLDIEGFHPRIEAAKGSYEEIKDYMEKEDKQPWEFGIADKAMGDRSAKTKEGIKARNEKLISSDLTALVAEGEIEIEKYIQIKKNVAQYKMDVIKIGGYMERKCLWLYGSPGCGKSRWCREKYPGFYTKPQNKWWDGYKGEETVVLDDYDTPTLSHYLKIWADVYSFYGEIKGGTVACNYTTLVVTSNYQPHEIWTEDKDRVLVDAICRRFEIGTVEDLKDR